MEKQIYSKADERMLKIVNGSPALLSFLYDMDLIPEQLDIGSNGWRAMKLVACGYIVRKLEQESLAKGGN